MKSSFDIVGLGACSVDVVTAVNEFAHQEKKVSCSSSKWYAGGVTANNLVQAAKLGSKVAWCGALGKDAEGKFSVDAFQKEHVVVHAKLFEKTQNCFIVVDKKADRQIYSFPNAAREITPFYVRKYFSQVIKQARHFHTELAAIPFSCSLAGAKIAKKSGAKIFLDMDGDVHQLISEGLGTLQEAKELIVLADVIKLSNISLNALFSKKTQRDSIKQLLKTTQLVAVTLGAKGCMLVTKEQSKIFKGENVRAVDTTGAGDAFMGALSHALLHNYSFEETGIFANRCGAYACTGKGARFHLKF